MKLTPKIVGDVLETTLGYRVEMNPYGFELRNAEPARARLQRGSGIAGRGYVWMLMRLPAGQLIVTNLDTKTKLVRAVLEFMAGPPPGVLTDYTAPRAKRVIHPSTKASSFVWYRRPKAQPKSKVQLVPFGAAQR